MADEKREQENVATVSGGYLFVEVVCPKCGGLDNRKIDYRIVGISGVYCPAGCGEMFSVTVENPFTDAGHAALAAARSEWVDVVDWLPDAEGEYLVTLSGDGAIRNALFDNGDWNDPDFGVSYGTDSQSDVIAWCELPQPYQRQSREGDSK